MTEPQRNGGSRRAAGLRRRLESGSLRARLILGAALWVTMAFAIGWLALTALFRDAVERQVAADLIGHLDQLTAKLQAVAATAEAPVDPSAALAETPSLMVDSLTDPRFARPYSDLYWQVSAAGGAVVARSRSPWDAVLPLPPDVPADGTVHRHWIEGPADQRLMAVERAVWLPVRTDFLRLSVASDESRLIALTEGFARPLALSLAVLGAAVVAAAAVQVTLGLRPLGRLRLALGRVRGGAADRLEGAFPEEVRPLVDDLKALIADNATVLDRTRREAGDLAHALKTPLAVLGGAAEAARRRGEARTAAAIEEAAERMRRQVDWRLARARAAAAAGPGVPGRVTRPAERLRTLARVMAQAHGETAPRITIDVPEDVAVGADRPEVDEMLGNLLDNACKWAAAEVRVAGAVGSGRAILTVDDDGPGLDAAGRAAAFDRGARLDTETPGSGLGLAIVRDLAELSGGSVRLEASPLGGLRARLELPTA